MPNDRIFDQLELFRIILQVGKKYLFQQMVQIVLARPAWCQILAKPENHVRDYKVAANQGFLFNKETLLFLKL